MINGPFVLFAFLTLFHLTAQQNNVTTVRDAYLSIATDARAAGQADIGAATSTDAFSQFWNPEKYVFSDKKFEIGVTQIVENSNQFNEFSQLNLTFYNKRNERSAYALSVRNFSYPVNNFIDFGTTYNTHGVAIDGSYTLKLSNEFAMSVGGRFIALNGKAPQFDGDYGASGSNLYGIDVSGFYFGNEIAYKKFNGRWRAGFNFSNLRGKPSNDISAIEIYAPSLLRTGAGFDFIFDQDNVLGITAEYKMLLKSYTANADGEALDFGLEGSVMAIGFEYIFKEKVLLRAGYSHGINRATDSFGALGAGFRSNYADLDIAFLLGLAQEENPFRNNLRISVSLNLEEVFSN